MEHTEVLNLWKMYDDSRTGIVAQYEKYARNIADKNKISIV
jgi:hypothetical protein